MHEDEYEIICPYCDCIQYDLFESLSNWADTLEKVFCEKCHKEFLLKWNAVYSSYKKEEG